MTLSKLKKEARIALDRVGNKNFSISQTSLWKYCILTDFGQDSSTSDPGKILFNSNPWVISAPSPKRFQHLNIPQKVLVIGTNTEISTLSSENPLDQKAKIKSVYEICLKHSVRRVHLEFVSRLVNFWTKFFGTEDFIDSFHKRKIPSLIITTGYMRNYSNLGGETLCVHDRILEIGKTWNIPVEFIDSFCP